jgi:hypothetical protein
VGATEEEVDELSSKLSLYYDDVYIQITTRNVTKSVLYMYIKIYRNGLRYA